MCECFKVGGPFIDIDPDCSIHGTNKDPVFDEVESLRTKLSDAQNLIKTLSNALNTVEWYSPGSCWIVDSDKIEEALNEYTEWGNCNE
jgi:hypothetical protein